MDLKVPMETLHKQLKNYYFSTQSAKPFLKKGYLGQDEEFGEVDGGISFPPCPNEAIRKPYFSITQYMEELILSIGTNTYGS